MHSINEKSSEIFKFKINFNFKIYLIVLTECKELYDKIIQMAFINYELTGDFVKSIFLKVPQPPINLGKSVHMI